MSFGGSVSAMISSLKSNKQLLANRKTMKDIVKDNHYQSNGSLKYKELPEAELKELKARIKAKLQFQFRVR